MYCIVEGHGDADAVPLLIRRIAVEEGLIVPTIRHSRVSRTAIVRHGEFERALMLARIRVGAGGPVLVVLDADDDCPAQLGPALLARAQAATDLNVSVVLAKREFEAWFLAAAVSLRTAGILTASTEPPNDPEGIQGAKEWLTEHMGRVYSYSPPIDQPALTAQFDLATARTSPSFDKCYREIVRLLS